MTPPQLPPAERRCPTYSPKLLVQYLTSTDPSPEKRFPHPGCSRSFSKRARTCRVKPEYGGLAWTCFACLRYGFIPDKVVEEKRFEVAFTRSFAGAKRKT